jgi:hypothetical protein
MNDVRCGWAAGLLLVLWGAAGLAAPPAESKGANAKPDTRRSDTLLGRQAPLVAGELAHLAAQTPGTIDLYGIGFAGDGAENVFRNEVEYFGQLLPRRFGARGRTLALINSPGTAATTPLATLDNLRAALAGVGQRMDRDEDVLLLFLTSHGTQEHEVVAHMPPLEPDFIDPKELRAALDASGIRWRVVVVSTCYSGGFIAALKSPETMVITASRADRASFGCGADSDITYFGKAFLTEALNRTTDFREAFDLARRRISQWEYDDRLRPSQPQIWTGEALSAHLQRWHAGLAPASPVPFVPAVPAVGQKDVATAR